MESNILHIYPTSRAIRERKKELLLKDSLVPNMITISEFEKRAIILNGRLVTPIEKVIYLKEASSFEQFKKFNIDNRSLIKIYSHIDDFFRFFEELAYERVNINQIYMADTYAEFDKEIAILEILLKNYRSILKEKSLTDRIFIPDEYRLNLDFINSYDKFIFHMEGFLTKFEMELLNRISEVKPFEIRYPSNKFSKKMKNLLLEYKIKIEDNSHNHFNLTTKKLLDSKQIKGSLDSELVLASSRFEQIAIALARVEKYVQMGIEPEKIAIILPDESLSGVLKQFDRASNLSLAMGVAYKFDKSFIILDEILKYLNRDEISAKFISNLSIDIDILPTSKITVDEFFNTLKELNLPLYSSQDLLVELDKFNLLESFLAFKRVLNRLKLNFKEWLFLWLNEIKDTTIDDVDGGKIRVLGLLESRGIKFDAIIILDFIDSLVPNSSNKDRFLNSFVRERSGLPTRRDRENLQKYYYLRALQNSKHSTVIYYEDGDNMVSRFIYELGLDSKKKEYISPLKILYKDDKKLNLDYFKIDNKIDFNPFSIVWSSKKLKTFLECKRKFYYEYTLKFKEPSDMDFNRMDGIYIHLILSKIFTPNTNFKNLEEIKKSYKLAIGEIDELKNLDRGFLEYKKLLWEKMLNRFFENQLIHLKNYSIISVEEQVLGDISGLKFTGRVDRIDKSDDNYLIIDYKTGSSNRVRVDKIKDFQSAIYKNLVSYNGKKEFSYANVFDGVINTVDNLDEIELKLKEHIEEIKLTKEFTPDMREDMQKCNFCGFKLLCKRGEFLNG